MANYVEGRIAVTGKYTNLKKFILQGLVTESNGVPPTLDEEDQCLKDTGAALLMIDTSLVVHSWGDDIPLEIVRDDIYTVRMELTCKWKIQSSELLDIAQKYNLNINASGEETVDYFQQNISIKNGQIIRDDVFTLVDND
ncbi:hypothetical protein C6Y02_17270 [Bacillus sp. NMCC4]|uniref:hypothetical protein n=1 Tax=Bacillus TaxID=1386 RepID=UPI000D025266|nr:MULTISPECIES: hypothetical protein [Bacillus]PRS35762.1 hypothetical protein C6Y02_17270 [Bacillus sp. NMCC4]UUD44607.1 hypothetical protein NPA43_18915 [Bacillus pumilus]